MNKILSLFFKTMLSQLYDHALPVLTASRNPTSKKPVIRVYSEPQTTFPGLDRYLNPPPVQLAAGMDSLVDGIQLRFLVSPSAADVLAEMAAGTGGTFFQNSNDLDEGFKRTASAPEYIYLLGFSPQNLKMDGSFHALKVSLKKPNSQSPASLNVNARRGYYAPTHLADVKETARRESHGDRSDSQQHAQPQH